MVANSLTELARTIMRTFADVGVEDVVVSPGSRSTPFVVAAVREPRLRCHSIIDERAAAFFALGRARVTQRPTVLLCTSGSAAAHYFPAVVEAAMAYVPLVVLTADRPPELHDCHAPQTIDQVKIYGDYARHFFDLVPQPTAAALRGARRVIAQAVLASRFPLAGPVHVNARASKPLEPAVATTPEEKTFAEIASAIREEPVTAAYEMVAQPSSEAIAKCAELVSRAQRGLVVCGPAPLRQKSAREAIASLARATGFGVWAEATSQLRFCGEGGQLDALDLVWRTNAGRARLLPDLVVQIGAPPISNAWEAIAAPIPRVVLAESGWQDPWSSARVIAFGDPAASAAALAAAVKKTPPQPSDHAEALASANARAWKCVDEAVDRTFGEGAATRVIVSRAPRGSLLFVGNSLSVRLVDTYCPSTSNDLGVLSQRGASGIDGLVAGAVGASLASNEPVTLLVGDVSLLHDVSSLSLARRVRSPLVVVVLNNRGGRIFEQLPLARATGIEKPILDLTLTPHDVDFAKAAALYDVPFARARTRDELSVALDAAYASGGPTLVEVTVPDHGAAALQNEIIAALQSALV